MAKPSPIHLSILTPEHAFYDAYIDRIILPTPDGELGIEPGHVPMVISVIEGEIRVSYEKNGKPQTDIAACSAGFATVTQHHVLLMVQTAEWSWEIDQKRAERDARAAQAKLRQQRSMQEYYLARSMMARAMARLRVSNRNKINH